MELRLWPWCRRQGIRALVIGALLVEWGVAGAGHPLAALVLAVGTLAGAWLAAPAWSRDRGA